MSVLAVNATGCASAAFTSTTLFGAQIHSIEANLVTDYSFNVPKGWTYSQPALDVQNAMFCNVTVTYSHTTEDDNIVVEAWLPTEENYNGRLQAVGGGGWTPGRFILSYAAMTNAVASGYATVTTDAGIPTAQNPTDWLLKSPGVLDTNALQNFGQVAMKDEAVIVKQLISSYYGQEPLYSYWNGCSQGGRMGMKVAQQYPDVYDGIMAAAPALNWAEFYINSIWPSFYMENTQQFPRDCELNALTTLGVAACDSLDGVKDGLISDPEGCRAAFDPFSHVGDSFFCSTTNTTLAITQAAAAVANASWTGPRFSNGKFLYDGYEIGSDLSVIAPTNCTGEVCTSGGRANILFPWQAFVMKDPSATLPNITDGTFDTIYRAVMLVFASNMETDEIDLRDFRDAGGKLMTYHGLADQSISPGGTLRYYNKVADFVGNVTSFYKYYRVPGLEHCWGGNGGQPEQMFSQLRAWVENGTEPQSSPVVVTTSNNTAQQQILCPYPQKATMDTSCASANSTLCWSCSDGFDFATLFREDISKLTGENWTLQRVDRIANVKASGILLGSFTGNRSAITYQNGKSTSEGYELTVSPTAAVIGGTGARGMWWGTRTLLQLLVAHNGSLPVGTTVDAPAYETRGFMLDAGRKWYAPGFLKELCSYASFFKLSEFHYHLSDNYPLNRGKNESWQDVYSHFSLRPEDESLLPILHGRENETLSREDFVDLQSHCAARGVTVIPEIEAPGHCLYLTKWKPELSLAKRDLLNLSHPDTIPTVKRIWSEFLPWFETKEVHVGADEYDATLADDYIGFVNEMSEFINNTTGKKIRIWGTEEPSENLTISKDVIIQHWQYGQSDPVLLANTGYDIINSEDWWAYMSIKNDHMPILPARYPQFFNESRVLNFADASGWQWTPADYNPFNKTEQVPDASPDNKGAILAAWNDNGPDASTQLEAYYAMRRGIALVGARSWSGSRGPKLVDDEVSSSIDVFSPLAPGQNLDRRCILDMEARE
ncbi:hypothetical protein K4K60_010485 [Colletotrichum sp. SAR11_57]|nr:hypothetical protein K4K60_010485 [Colletotrichum sp. SAR11_57]